jgi:hypothetical protein
MVVFSALAFARSAGGKAEAWGREALAGFTYLASEQG